MTPQASARRPAAGTTLRSVQGGRGDDGPSSREGRGSGRRRPALVPVTGDGRAGAGRMRKGETPKERGERTRARIAGAVLDLLAESDLPPTAKEVAARAGVSVRLVFHHFEDMDALYRAVSQVQMERHWKGRRSVPPDLPLVQRIDRTVRDRAKLFETIGPVRRKAVSLVLRHQDIGEQLETTNALLRVWLEESFARELQEAGRERRELLAAIDAAASWETWERLRQLQGLPPAAARRVVQRMLHSLLEGA